MLALEKFYTSAPALQRQKLPLGICEDQSSIFVEASSYVTIILEDFMA